ncbi:alpha/beta hydrolase [Pedobacter helvus]|uniref:Alpha/beta hydrolase n=1 Tax=Pedobacter helvus TaxID=2563444 RepID=A0ABW9JNQ7_9SPHI|nr:alpha/beta hydrolase [Pedobacter ureilyticus]
MKKILIALVLLSGYAKAQEFIPLYPAAKIPNSKGTKRSDSVANERIFRVATPGMYGFFPSKQENKGAAVIICPGGGYERLAYVISGTQLAKWFNTMGINAFVLNYRLPNDPDLKDRAIAPLQDAQRALKLVRSRAIEWGIKPNKIGFQGSSAGGHLASLVATTTQDLVKIGDALDTISVRPNFAILVSPVIDMQAYAHKGSRKNLLGENPTETNLEKFSTHLQVTAQTPTTFIVHAFNDNSVSVNNSLLFYQALVANKVPSSLHVFPQGGHAIALRNNPGSTNLWTTLCEQWMIEMSIISAAIK